MYWLPLLYGLPDGCGHSRNLCNLFPPEDLWKGQIPVSYTHLFDMVAKQVSRFLKPGGTFLFSCEHPVFTSEGSQQWVTNPDGSIAHFPVDNYYYEGKRTANFLGCLLYTSHNGF